MPGISQFGLQLVDAVLQVLFQAHCIGCQISDRPLVGGLCRYCRIFFPLRGPLCDRCGTPTTQPTDPCGECGRRKRHAIQAVRSLLWLEESTKAVIHRVKYRGRFELLDLFRPEIETRFEPFYDGSPTVIPIPLPARRLWDRGFNQAELLARWVARREGLSIDLDGLRKRRATQPQATLSVRERQANLRGSFVWRGRKVPARALLIDDIYTTGATLHAGARVLRQAGVKEVYAWTLFRTPSSSYLSAFRSGPLRSHPEAVAEDVLHRGPSTQD